MFVLSNDNVLFWGQTEKQIISMMRNSSRTKTEHIREFMKQVAERALIQTEKTIRIDNFINFVYDLQTAGLIHIIMVN